MRSFVAIGLITGLAACGGDAERIAALEARIVELEAKQAALESRVADLESAPKRYEPAPREAAPAVDWPVRADGEDRYVVDHARLKSMIEPTDVARMARAIPHLGPDGDVDGFRLSGIRLGSLPAALGLKNGDVVHEVDGVPIVDAAAVMEVYGRVGSRERVEARVTRRGAKKTLVWEAGSVAADPDTDAP